MTCMLMGDPASRLCFPADRCGAFIRALFQSGSPDPSTKCARLCHAALLYNQYCAEKALKIVIDKSKMSLLWRDSISALERRIDNGSGRKAPSGKADYHQASFFSGEKRLSRGTSARRPTKKIPQGSGSRRYKSVRVLHPSDVIG